MKIYLLDINKKMTDAWSKVFADESDVEIVNQSFKFFMDNHPEIDGIVSPANSFGLMDGGYDRAITEYFGDGLMKDVQKEIILKWYGEQPVGTSLSVDIRNRIIGKFPNAKYATLIHTPTMRTPEIIVDDRIVYQCMRTTLIEAAEQSIENIVIPAFGGATGQVPFDTIAKMMFLAYEQLINAPEKLNWKYAMSNKKKIG